MNLNEMKRIKNLLFQATNERNKNIIEEYLADEIIWHEGYAGDNGTELTLIWNKQQFIEGNIMGFGAFPDRKKLVNL